MKQWTSDFLQITFNPRFESSYKFFTRCALDLVRREIKDTLSIYCKLRTFRELVDQYLLRVHAPLDVRCGVVSEFWSSLFQAEYAPPPSYDQPSLIMINHSGLQ